MTLTRICGACGSTVRSGHDTGSDGPEHKDATGSCCRPAESCECRIRQSVVRVVRMVIVAVRVRLPDLHQTVLDGRAVSVDQPAGDGDPLAARGIRHEAIGPLGSIPDQQLEERSDGGERRELGHGQAKYSVQ